MHENGRDKDWLRYRRGAKRLARRKWLARSNVSIREVSFHDLENDLSTSTTPYDFAVVADALERVRSLLVTKAQRDILDAILLGGSGSLTTASAGLSLSARRRTHLRILGLLRAYLGRP